MPEYSYSAEHIHLPPEQTAIKVLQIISYTGLSLATLGSLILLLDRLIGFNNFSYIISPKWTNTFNLLAFLLSSISVIFYSKKVQSKLKNYRIALLTLGILTASVGLTDVFINGFANLQLGYLFIPIGISILVTGLKIPHRYHYAQIILFSVSIFTIVILFDNLFRIISAVNTLNEWFGNFWRALLFTTLTLSLMLSKGDRGFIGIYSSDSHSSQLARRSVFSFAILIPIYTFLILAFERVGYFDLNFGLALFVVTFMALLVIITWANIKALYPSEVERFLMQEALRVNNISLELHKSDLSTKVIELENAKQEMASKLNNQNTLIDILDKT